MQGKKASTKVPADSDSPKSIPAKTATTKKAAAKKVPSQKKAPVAKKTAAEIRKAQKVKNDILGSVAKVIFPLWFNYPSKSIRTLVNGPQMRAEAALALAFHGAILEASEASSVTHCEIMIYQYGFDKFEANYIAFMGTASLNGSKHIKYVGGRGDDMTDETRKLVLAAKGRRLYEYLRNAIVTK